MQSTTRQALELQRGLGRDPLSVPDRHAETARAVIVDDNQRRSGALAAALKLVAAGWSHRGRARRSGAARPAAPRRSRAARARRPDVSALGIGAEAVQKQPVHRGRVLLRRPGRARGCGGVGSRHHAHRPRAAHGRPGWRAAEICSRAARACGGRRRRARRRCRGRRRWWRSPTARLACRFRRRRCSSARATSGSCWARAAAGRKRARRAGVPYRTMCEMIRKLGIGTA